MTIAAILSVLLGVMNFPGPWMALFPGAEEAPDFIIYTGIALGIIGLVLAVGLLMLARWSYWSNIVVMALNLLLGAPGLFEAPTAAIKIAIGVSMVIAAAVVYLQLRPDARYAFANPRAAAG